MAKLLAKCKLCRRAGEKLFLKGEKCNTQACPFIRRSYAPGQHGRIPRRLSEYGLQLREKQKAKRIYQVNERQFKNYFKKAEKMKGVTGENLLRLLEMRLDNVVYRLGFSSSRAQARQIVSHGHILVNGRKVNIPSYQVKVGDKIALKEKSRKSFPILKVEKLPSWLSFDKKTNEGKVVDVPVRGDIDFNIAEDLIIEFYGR